MLVKLSKSVGRPPTSAEVFFSADYDNLKVMFCRRQSQNNFFYILWFHTYQINIQTAKFKVFVLTSMRSQRNQKATL